MHHRSGIPELLSVNAAHQAGLVTHRQALRHGLTPGAVRGLVAQGILQPLTRGVFDLRSTGPAPNDWSAQRRRAAWLALLAYGPQAVAVGTCALALHGIEGLPLTIRPEAAVRGGESRRHRAGIRLRQFDDGMTSTVIDGARVATAQWALAQAVPELPRRNGLAVLDSALRRQHLTRSGLERSHDLARGRRGVAIRHDLWALADPRADSPLESFARLECIEEGVAPDALQLGIVDDNGTVIARGDLAWRRDNGRWLVGELDGRDIHSTIGAVYADRARQNRLVGSGAVDLLRFTGRDLGQIAQTVRHVLGR